MDGENVTCDDRHMWLIPYTVCIVCIYVCAYACSLYTVCMYMVRMYTRQLYAFLLHGHVTYGRTVAMTHAYEHCYIGFSLHAVTKEHLNSGYRLLKRTYNDNIG